MLRHEIICGALLATAVLFSSSQLLAQQDVIEKRQKLMKGQGAAAKALKKAVEEKDFATIEVKAKDLVGSSGQITELFPKGSTSDKSRAKAEIWEKWDDFKNNAAQLKKSSSELAEAAAAKDEARVKARLDDVSKACSSCHKTFRAEKKS
ncbi:MAG TPA: cytochrome c [Candidatus Acidoferrales bacterium]|nr:cytochrome c [Candidatus Acidoferrales bacterium]